MKKDDPLLSRVHAAAQVQIQESYRRFVRCVDPGHARAQLTVIMAVVDAFCWLDEDHQYPWLPPGSNGMNLDALWNTKLGRLWTVGLREEACAELLRYLRGCRVIDP